MIRLIRAIIQSTVEGAIKRFTATGRPGEEFTDREHFKHYGFTSRPPKGAEAIVLKQGNVIFIIAEDDRRYRLQIEEGEVALYTDEGDKIHLKRGNVIEIKAASRCVINSPSVELSDGTLKALVTEDLITYFNSHTHTGVTTGTGTSGAPATPLQSSQVCTQKVKGA